MRAAGRAAVQEAKKVASVSDSRILQKLRSSAGQLFQAPGAASAAGRHCRPERLPTPGGAPQGGQWQLPFTRRASRLLKPKTSR
jgi:hypothetical protein